MNQLRNKKNRNFIKVCVLIAVAIVLVGFFTANIRKSSSVEDVSAKKIIPKLDVVFSLPSFDVKFFDFSTSGQHIYIQKNNNTIDIYTKNGLRQCILDAAELDTPVVSADGNYIMTYSRLNSDKTFVRFFHGDGKQFSQMKLDGAVWDADVAVTENGAVFIVGVGSKRIYIINFDGNSRRYKRKRVNGVVVSLRVRDDGESFVYGCWQKSSVGCMSIDGKSLWKKRVDSTLLQYVENIIGSNNALIKSIPNCDKGEAIFNMIDKDGNDLVSRYVDMSDKPRAVKSPNGQYLCVASVRQIVHKEKSLVEKNGVLIDDRGSFLWQKGSLFFPIDPILVTNAGFTLTSDGKGKLHIMDRDGNVNPTNVFGGSVVEWSASPSQYRALVKCSDNSIYMIQIKT